MVSQKLWEGRIIRGYTMKEDIRLLTEIIKDGSCFNIEMYCDRNCPIFKSENSLKDPFCVVNSKEKAIKLLQQYPADIVFEVML